MAILDDMKDHAEDLGKNTKDRIRRGMKDAGDRIERAVDDER